MIRSSKRCSEAGLKFQLAMEGKIQMGLIPNLGELKDTVEEAIDLLRRAVAALEKFAAEQERANDLYAEVNQVSLAQAPSATLRMAAGSTSAFDGDT
jgi:D-Tyr-tRNAtyr deacylase